MIQLTSAIYYDATILDRIVKTAVPSAIGVNVSSSGTVVLLPDGALSSNQTDAQNAMSNYGGLAIVADKTSMMEGDADPVIICNDAQITSDSDVTYIVFLDGAEYASGIANVVSGIATLNLIAPVAGEYDIVVYRNTGNYASGSVSISVSEV